MHDINSRTVTGAGLKALAAGLVLSAPLMLTITAPAAAAASTPAAELQQRAWPSGGVVVHHADAYMRIAILGTGPNTARCSVKMKPWEGAQRVDCHWQRLPSGKGSSGYYADVDAFTFPNTSWFYNGFRVSAGDYVKIRDGQVVYCGVSMIGKRSCVG